MSTRGILITLATIFLQTPWLVSARWEDRPILGLFCFDFLPAWVCVKDRAKYFIESNCDASADTSQLEVVLDFYFKAGQESNQGSLYEQGWFSDCNFCSWDGITCDGGNITGLDMSKWMGMTQDDMTWLFSINLTTSLLFLLLSLLPSLWQMQQRPHLLERCRLRSHFSSDWVSTYFDPIRFYQFHSEKYQGRFRRSAQTIHSSRSYST